MEFEFIEGNGNFVATDKVLVFLRTHLARGEVQQAARLYEDSAGPQTATDLLREASSASSTTQKAMAEMFLIARDFKNAAVVFEMARGLERAAQLYEQGLDFDNAARVYEKVGPRPIRRLPRARRQGRQGHRALQEGRPLAAARRGPRAPGTLFRRRRRLPPHL